MCPQVYAPGYLPQLHGFMAMCGWYSKENRASAQWDEVNLHARVMVQTKFPWLIHWSQSNENKKPMPEIQRWLWRYHCFLWYIHTKRSSRNFKRISAAFSYVHCEQIQLHQVLVPCLEHLHSISSPESLGIFCISACHIHTYRDRRHGNRNHGDADS